MHRGISSRMKGLFANDNCVTQGATHLAYACYTFKTCTLSLMLVSRFIKLSLSYDKRITNSFSPGAGLYMYESMLRLLLSTLSSRHDTAHIAF